METLSAIQGQSQNPPVRRGQTSAPRSQPSEEVDRPQNSAIPEKPVKSEEPAGRLAELAKSVGDEIQNLVPSNSHLQIVRHEETGTFVYRVLDAETGEIVSQYPADETLRELAFWRNLKGISVDTSA